MTTPCKACEAQAQLCLAEKVSEQSAAVVEEDAAYNRACRDCAEAIRSSCRHEPTSPDRDAVVEECAKKCEELYETTQRNRGKPSKTWGCGVMDGRASAARELGISIRALKSSNQRKD